MPKWIINLDLTSHVQTNAESREFLHLDLVLNWLRYLSFTGQAYVHTGAQF